MRDSQRTKVYQAEELLLFPEEKIFPDIEACQRYVDRILRSKWWKKNCLRPWIQITLSERRGGGGTAWGANTIEIGRRSFRQMLILHELSHCAVSHLHVKHGREWCNFYLQLVRRFAGAKIANDLKAHFRFMKVKYSLGRSVSF